MASRNLLRWMCSWIWRSLQRIKQAYKLDTSLLEKQVEIYSIMNVKTKKKHFFLMEGKQVVLRHIHYLQSNSGVKISLFISLGHISDRSFGQFAETQNVRLQNTN